MIAEGSSSISNTQAGSMLDKSQPVPVLSLSLSLFLSPPRTWYNAFLQKSDDTTQNVSENELYFEKASIIIFPRRVLSDSGFELTKAKASSAGTIFKKHLFVAVIQNKENKDIVKFIIK